MRCKMMKIQDYILTHPDWEKTLSEAPYALKIKRSPFAHGRYVMFNYDMIESDNYDSIVKDARGLVLDSEANFKAVRKGFNRFFNYGEAPAAKIDWDSADATIKEDGTLIFLSHYDGRWIWGTRQNFDVENAEMQSTLYPTFGALLKDVIAKHYPKFDVTKALEGDTYCFELCTRFNRIVIDYPEPKLFLLAVFDNDGAGVSPGFEYSSTYANSFADVWEVDRPKYYKMSSPEDYTNLVEGFGVRHEGIVVRDAHGQRVKMKSKLYFELHKTVNNGCVTDEAAVKMIRTGEDAEFLSYFPEYKKRFDELRFRVNCAIMRVKFIKTCVEGEINEEHLSRKDFALRHKDEPQAMLWFKALDGKLTDDFVASITDEKFIQLFNIS